MIANNVFTVRTWTGEDKPCKKITLFPERDSYGNIFFKMEGQLNTEFFMINYFYDKEKAISEYLHLHEEMMNYQIDYLLGI